MIGQAAKALVAVALALGTGQIHQRTPPASPLDLDEEFVPRPAMVKLASLGFEAALADYYWLRAVQIVGAERVEPSRHSAVLGRMIDLVTTLDPWVDHPYRFAAIWLTDSAESVRQANALLRRGIEYHPDEWRNHFYLGFNHFFYLGENSEAAEALAKASSLPGAPAYLPRLAARLRSQTGDLATAAAFITQLARDTEDEELRSNYLAALDEIEVERRARQLDAAREQYRERVGRDLDDVGQLLVGPNPVLQALPDAEPASLPNALRRGASWRLDAETGRIVSSYYGRRYELTVHRADADRRERWQRERSEASSS
ncbi:MAG: hypothetical protein VX681_07395 [Myxococcota bacterium]|nr:hypothetical protein [Myxococcota bacterium]